MCLKIKIKICTFFDGGGGGGGGGGVQKSFFRIAPRDPYPYISIYPSIFIINISIYLFLRLSIYLSISLFIYLSLSLYLSIYIVVKVVLFSDQSLFQV